MQNSLIDPSDVYDRGTHLFLRGPAVPAYGNFCTALCDIKVPRDGLFITEIAWAQTGNPTNTRERMDLLVVFKKCITYLSSVLVLLVQLSLAGVAVAGFVHAQTPVGNWTFDDGSGATAADSISSDHGATLVNGAKWVPGQIGDAVSVNALENQYVSIPPIDLSNTQAVTVALWVNRTYSTDGGHALFEATDNFNNSQTGFGLFPDDSSCKGIKVALRGDVGYTANCYGQPSSGVWHHLGVVFDKSQTGGNEIRFYVDGALQNTNWSLNASTNTNNFGNNRIFLFSRAGATEFDSGTVDDLRIYKSALTTAQIQHIYNSGILVSLAVTPTGPTIAVGVQQQFTAIGAYKDGSRKDVSSSVNWTPSVSSIATVSGSGMATAQAVGSSTIQASLGNIKNSAALTVTPALLVSLAVTPASASIGVGQKQQFTATGTYSDGSHQNLTGIATWTSSTPSVATIAGGRAISLNTPGVATGIAAGTTTISATSGSVSGSTTLTVTAATLVSIAVTPANPTIAAGQQLQFTATGTYTDGSHQNLTSTAVWSSSAPSVATVSAGLATALAAGTTTISATSGSISGSTTLTVTAATLVSIAVTPANPTIAAGQQMQFTATGTYTDGSHQNLTSTAVWSSSAPSVATVSAGLATALAAGSTTIKATSGSVSGSTTLTVTAATLVSIAVTPANPTIAAGQQLQFTATGTYTDGSHQNLTSTAVWSSSAPSVATVSAGLATALAAGTTTISATSGSISGSTTLTVTAATLVSIAVTPANPTIAAGQQMQFTATGTYTDGSHQNLTSTAVWSSSAPSVATVSAGLATALAAGSTTIKATSGSVSGSTTLTVTAATLVSIAVTPANPTIAAGQQLQFTATGTYTDGSHQNLTSTAVWSSSAPSVATVSAGLATALAAGTTTISATSGSISGSTTLTVTAATLVSIAVTPANPTIAAGQQMQFTATGTYTDGSHQNLTSTAVWSSSAPSVATVSAGLATALAAGSTTIKATSGSVSGSTALTVTAQPIVSLVWTASTSQNVVGYIAYRSLTSGGPYTKLNANLIANTSYIDQTVQSGTTYYYVTTAIDSQGLESVYSNEAGAAVP